MKPWRKEVVAGVGIGLGALLLAALYVREKEKVDTLWSAFKTCEPFSPPPGTPVWLVGDSLGVGLTSPLRKQMLDRFSVSLSATPVQGHSTKQTLGHLPAGSLPAEGLAIVSLGSNDAAGLVDPVSMKVLVDKLSASGARVLWVVPPNFQLATPPLPATKAKQEAFLDVLRTDSRVELLVPSDDVVASLGADRVHLPPVGHALLAKQVADTLACST